MKQIKPLYLFLFIFLCTSLYSQAQQKDMQYWKVLLHQPFDSVHTISSVFWDSLQHRPPSEIAAVMQQLDAEQSPSQSPDEQARLLLVKMEYTRLTEPSLNTGQFHRMAGKLQQLVTIAEDPYLEHGFCDLMGDVYLKQDKIDTALFYLLKCVSLAEQLGFSKTYVANYKIATSNALYHSQDYRKCIDFCQTDIDIEKTFAPITVVTAYNNTGLSYIKLGHADSAILYFKKAVDFCHRIHWGVWEGIASGNIGDALHVLQRDAEAMPYWQTDYDSSLKYGELSNAGLTLAYMSQQQFLQGQREVALKQLNWSVAVNMHNAASLEKVYRVKAFCMNRMGLADSLQYYLLLAHHITDSVNQVVSQGNYTVAQLRLGFEQSHHEFELLKKERRAEMIKRNLLLLALLSFIIIAILLYNRQRLKIKLARQQQAIAEAENKSAREQLELFTQTLLEKNEQIETLHQTLEQHTQAANDELIHQTLLTDYDWNRFKELFDKIYPSFFSNLKNMAPAVTQSEMRLAALIKLNLDNKQMASMQGISVSSLRGNKTRLRQKLNISADTDLDLLLKQL